MHDHVTGFAYNANMASAAKAAVQARLKARGMTQVQLAAEIGTSPAVLSRTLSSPLIARNSHWPAILAALKLQAVVVPEGENHDRES